MPILDPSLQCCLLKNFHKEKKAGGINFFLYYLRIASRYMNKSITAIETSIKFKNDLKNSILFLNKELGCNFNVNDDFNFSINDFYKYLYNNIILISNKDKISKVQKGSFYICDDQFNTKFFQPSVFYSQQHAWFFSDTPIAILCIDDDNISETLKELIKLEIDLMTAAGFILVLCCSCTSYTIDFYLQLIKENQFAEIHFNILDESYVTIFFETIHNKVKSHLDYYKGYFYLYSNFASPSAIEIVRKFIKKPKFQFVFYCDKLENTFKKISLYKSKPFLYCKTGFKSKYLRVHLSNIPIYDEKDMFSKVSGVGLAYISPNDFFKWSKDSIKVLYDDPEKNNHHVKKYVNFNDIHKIRPDLYVNKTISLMNISKQKLKEVLAIQKNINKRDDKDKKFKKEYIFSLFKDKKIIEGLEYVGYAYTKCFKNTIDDFSLHTTQLLTALDACQTFVLQINNPKEKGMIYQVETGEGKSCIICLIAAVLAIMKKTIHITSSNIKLANRDYIRSFEFFRMLGFESAILLHDNELPYSLKEKFINIDTNTVKNSDSNLNLKEVDLELDDFFGSNSSYYFRDAIESENNECKYDYYPAKFFKPKLFKNPSKMNFSVCGIDNNNKYSKLNQANIVFSTFVNFECLYLRMMESCQGIVNEFFSNCGLLIDEADSILIDEISNGTIVSRGMKSNAKPILKFVYKQRMNKITANDTYEYIKNHWPNHGSLKLKDIEQMYEEIDLVNEDEFSNGKKYSIETFQVKNSSKVKRFLKKTTKFIEQSSEKIENMIEKTKDTIKDVGKEIINEIVGNELIKLKEEEEDEEDEEEDNNDFEDEEEEIADTPIVEFKHIVPFDYDHKGILEPNKEFSGFIQQFIAIKEGLKEGNENMIIKDLALNYLYVSHPIFAKLYGKVCGFTGTVGQKKEQRIFSKMYLLNTRKVPRQLPNLRVELPMILCNDINERNKIIVNEVKHIHDKKYPVLVIFQDLKEIGVVEFMLNAKKIKYINIFDGKNEYIKPDKIAGLKGAVSLGTNVCGRGTDILIQSKPLHVIVSYYSTNSRVMRQAYGRTARQGQKGTYRVICVKDQYYSEIEQINGKSMNNSISEFDLKNKEQEKFIDYFKKFRPWIFSGDIKKQSFTKKQIQYMRETRINVNRIIAYNYKFPIRMKIKTFLNIQAQKIFSIFNCPNSKYTWMLFQRYIREMILESWSLMLNKFDDHIIEEQGIAAFRYQLNININKLCKKITKYIPEPKKQNDADIIPTFMNIFKIVQREYQENILNIYKYIPEAYKQFNSEGFCSCQFGFRPFSLLANSGARINLDNISEMNYIIDPELRYIQTMPGGRFSIMSITQRIDLIFNMICKKINDVIGDKIGLKFFLRRTLAGCEFGICFDVTMKANDSNNSLLNDYFCLIDKDPLLSFTIFIKNASPILAGILIIVLVYVAAISAKIITWISAFPVNFTKFILKKCLKLIIEYASEKIIEKILENLINYLEEIIDKQIAQITEIDVNLGQVLNNLFNLFRNIGLDGLGDKFSNFLGCKIKVRTKFGKFIRNRTNYSLLLKFGLYIILCIGSFMIFFNNNKQSVKNESKDAKVFNSKHDLNKAKSLTKKNKDKVKLEDIKEINNNKLNHGFDDFLKQTNTFLFKMELSDPSSFKVKSSDFIYDPKPISNKNQVGNSYYSYHIHVKNMKKCFQIQHYGYTKAFRQEVVLYSTFENPVIAHFVGFYIERNKNDFICIEMPKYGFLDEFIKKKVKDPFLMFPSKKLVIAYGIAYVMNYLHSCHVIHRDLQPANICLDHSLYPLLYNFYFARQTDQPESSKILKETSLQFMAPEFIKNPSDVQNSFKIDVYSYGMLLFNLMTEIKPFENITSKEDLINEVINGKRPIFTPSVEEQWIELISKCWDEDPDKRPTFQMILNDLESEKFLNTKEINLVFNQYKKYLSHK